MNLSPREPATRNWPLYNYPPPHFLVGYQKLLQICNDYIFDARAYSRLKYTEQLSFGSQIMNWSVMANCSYTVNTGAYHRFIDMDNFSETLTAVQQAILAERIVADLALIRPMRGFGRTSVDRNDVPVEYLLQEQYKDIGACQGQAWGLADRIRVQNAGRKDLVVLSSIRKLKTAYFNFLICRHLPLAQEQELNLPCDCYWLNAFVEKFAESDQSADISEAMRLQQVPAQILTKCIISALSLPSCHGTAMSGGAFQLRPREGNRAVTESMRRARGEMIEQFVDRLPMRRRRRRQPPPPPEEAPMEVEEESPETTFEEEVRAAVAEAIRLLEEELTVAARNQQFFSFAVNFYEVIQRLEALGDINELTLRRWVMYFFVAEHIATTLNYLNHQLRVASPFGRYVMLNLAQVVMRARSQDGRLVYSRVWNENGEQAFSAIMNRISVDLAATVERAGRGELEEEEIEQFMAEIAYHENSGDVTEILRQVATNDSEIDSIEISFRFRVSGPVVFSGLREIQNINRRVIRAATMLRQERRPLPALNEAVRLPPPEEQ